MENEEQILSKYKENQEILATRDDGCFVIGEEVDQDNILWYVIKNEDESLTLEKAENQKVIGVRKRLQDHL